MKCLNKENTAFIISTYSNLKVVGTYTEIKI